MSWCFFFYVYYYLLKLISQGAVGAVGRKASTRCILYNVHVEPNCFLHLMNSKSASVHVTRVPIELQNIQPVNAEKNCDYGQWLIILKLSNRSRSLVLKEKKNNKLI